MMKNFVLLLFYFLVFRLTAQQSQIKVFPQDNQLFTQEKIINGLVSNGIQMVNVKTNFKYGSHVMGFFVDSTRYMGIGQGMILSTGVVDNITGKNTQQSYTSAELDSLKKESLTGGDKDLSADVTGLQTFDARVIEIKFIPTADSLYFRFVFASEEYEEYVCSAYNDIFAFYLSDKDGNKRNIALVPNQNLPISINSINNGNPQDPKCEKTNSYLFQKNDGTQNLLYDGFTKVLDIRQRLTPGEDYVLKIAIADVSDNAYDTAVLLESGSIFSYFESYEIPFDANASIPNDYEKLKQFLKSVKKYPTSKIQLIGHSDKAGSNEYNLELSQKRVAEIKKYLASKGVNLNRIVETYEGEDMPRYEEDEKNRRVEIFILGE
jgi:outer membrane protein OmpA-like peptidoglycan-associated protein